MDRVHLLIINRGPVILVRVPWPMPRWHSVLKALTPVMHSHGLLRKDISAIEMLTPEPNDPEFERYTQDWRNAEKAFAGSTNYSKVWLYDWRGSGFVFVREPLER